MLKAKNLTHLYNSKSTDGVKDLSFELSKGEILTIIGASGSGKSTTLKLIKNLLPYHSGSLQINEESRIEYVPQHTELPPDQTVFEFLKAKLHLLDEEKQENQIRSTLSTLQITNEIHSKIGSTSGGQRQRLIIAASLVFNPDILLMDEPFGHLDQILRFELISELFEVFKEKDISVIWVTHNTKEAFAFSDRIILMNFGKIIQVASPKELHNRPENLFVSKFIGQKNVIISKLTKKDHFKVLGKELEFKLDEFNPNDEVILYLDNNALYLDMSGKFNGEVLKSYYYGDYYWLKVKSNSQNIWIKSLDKNQNRKIKFSLNLDKVYFSKTL